jgi:predicted Zn-dependent peptidase
MTRSSMDIRARGAFAAFFFCLVACGLLVRPGVAAAPPTAPVAFSQVLPTGLTVVARKAGAAPIAALEVWIRCPSGDYDSSKPGIARLSALALLDQKSSTTLSLRDAAHIAGAQIGISVYAESTELAILTPSYAAPALLDKLAATISHPYIDQAAFDTARTRLAAGQVAAGEVVDQELRDALFTQMFAGGPLRDSTYGNPKSLRDMTLQDVTSFVGRAYVPANEIVVVVGDIDQQEAASRFAALSLAGSAQAMPESPLAPSAAAPFAIRNDQAMQNGVGLAWIGPPISDERAATAMDFLSDYLTSPQSGALVKAIAGVDTDADVTGQFITLRNPGVFFITAAGTKFDPATMPAFIRATVQSAVGHQFSRGDFDRARNAYVTHLLRDMQNDQGLADNYGWYFAQGALAYSPSATDVTLSGDYFSIVNSLSPDYVYQVAKKYLAATPSIVVLSRSASQ